MNRNSASNRRIRKETQIQSLEQHITYLSSILSDFQIPFDTLQDREAKSENNPQQCESQIISNLEKDSRIACAAASILSRYLESFQTNTNNKPNSQESSDEDEDIAILALQNQSEKLLKLPQKKKRRRKRKNVYSVEKQLQDLLSQFIQEYSSSVSTNTQDTPIVNPLSSLVPHLSPLSPSISSNIPEKEPKKRGRKRKIPSVEEENISKSNSSGIQAIINKNRTPSNIIITSMNNNNNNDNIFITPNFNPISTTIANITTPTIANITTPTIANITTPTTPITPNTPNTPNTPITIPTAITTPNAKRKRTNNIKTEKKTQSTDDDSNYLYTFPVFPSRKKSRNNTSSGTINNSIDNNNIDNNNNDNLDNNSTSDTTITPPPSPPLRPIKSVSNKQISTKTMSIQSDFSCGFNFGIDIPEETENNHENIESLDDSDDDIININEYLDKQLSKNGDISEEEEKREDTNNNNNNGFITAFDMEKIQKKDKRHLHYIRLLQFFEDGNIYTGYNLTFSDVGLTPRRGLKKSKGIQYDEEEEEEGEEIESDTLSDLEEEKEEEEEGEENAEDLKGFIDSSDDEFQSLMNRPTRELTPHIFNSRDYLETELPTIFSQTTMVPLMRKVDITASKLAVSQGQQMYYVQKETYDYSLKCFQCDKIHTLRARDLCEPYYIECSCGLYVPLHKYIVDRRTLTRKQEEKAQSTDRRILRSCWSALKDVLSSVERQCKREKEEQEREEKRRKKEEARIRREHFLLERQKKRKEQMRSDSIKRDERIKIIVRNWLYEQIHKIENRNTFGKVTLKDAITTGVFKAGKDMLSLFYMDHTYYADLTADGYIYDSHSGFTFTSPSQFGITIKKRLNPNKFTDDGWKSIKYNNQYIDTYREEIWRRLCEQKGFVYTPEGHSNYRYLFGSSTPAVCPYQLRSKNTSNNHGNQEKSEESPKPALPLKQYGHTNWKITVNIVDGQYIIKPPKYESINMRQYEPFCRAFIDKKWIDTILSPNSYAVSRGNEENDDDLEKSLDDDEEDDDYRDKESPLYDALAASMVKKSPREEKTSVSKDTNITSNIDVIDDEMTTLTDKDRVIMAGNHIYTQEGHSISITQTPLLLIPKKQFLHAYLPGDDVYIQLPRDKTAYKVHIRSYSNLNPLFVRVSSNHRITKKLNQKISNITIENGVYNDYTLYHYLKEQEEMKKEHSRRPSKVNYQVMNNGYNSKSRRAKRMKEKDLIEIAKIESLQDQQNTSVSSSPVAISLNNRGSDTSIPTSQLQVQNSTLKEGFMHIPIKQNGKEIINIKEEQKEEESEKNNKNALDILSQIPRIEDHYYFVSYYGYDDSYDEWITEDIIQLKCETQFQFENKNNELIKLANVLKDDASVVTSMTDQQDDYMNGEDVLSSNAKDDTISINDGISATSANHTLPLNITSNSDSNMKNVNKQENDIDIDIDNNIDIDIQIDRSHEEDKEKNDQNESLSSLSSKDLSFSQMDNRGDESSLSSHLPLNHEKQIII
ncbi:hypothetical protein WA158_007125 [Blastocystis sp. Blastoise]